MMSPPVTVIHVAGGAASASIGDDAPLPRSRGRDASDGDDEPLLSSSSSSSSSSSQAGRPTSPSAGASRRGGVSALGRLRLCVARVAASMFALVSSLTSSSSSSWLAKGLCVCVALVLLGGAGSVTLHQLMSPQIESLLRQRKEMQLEMDVLRSQVANQTRIAESRLEMIHLLEKELEKQVIAAATVSPSLRTGDTAARTGPPLRGAFVMPSNFWTTVAYAGILGLLVLVVVVLRIYQIARAETQRTQKARTSSDAEPLYRSARDGGLMETKAASSGGSRSAALFKRAPGNAPQDRLVHV